MMRSFLGLAVLLACTALPACNGEVEGAAANSASPPPVNTRFELRIDGKAVDLEAPSGTRFVTSDTAPPFVTISAQQDPGGGDYLRGASVGLIDPLATGTFDCTPNERGEFVNKPSFNPGDFFGFKATLTDCVLTVQYASSDRVVGTFSAKAHAPAGSSLSGTVSTTEGEFDVPVKETKL